MIAMTSIPPEGEPPLHDADPQEPARDRPRRQLAIVAVLLLIAVIVVLVLLL